MARRDGRTPEKQIAELSPPQISQAIRKLRKRLEELRAVDLSNPKPGFDVKLDALHGKLDGTLVETFGPETLDYQRNRIPDFYHSMPLIVGRSYSEHEKAEFYKEGIDDAIVRIETIIETLEEKLDDLGETPGGRGLRALDSLNLNENIELVASQRYRDGHYADAIEASCKVLTNLIQNKSGVFDLDGTDLVRRVFSAKKPLLCFTAFPYRDKSDESEQAGMMHLYEGAMLAVRNPRAHKLVEDDPERAMEFISFLSLLAKLLDDTKLQNS